MTNATLTECVRFIEEGGPPPFAAELGRSHDPLDVRVAVISLLDWLLDRVAGECDGPLELPAEAAWVTVLRHLVDNTDLKQLFHVRADVLDFAVGVADDERVRVESYVRENYHPPLFD